MISLTFFGAAGEVTGSCYRIHHATTEGSGSFLVDCGQFQGGRETYRRNLAALDFDCRTLDFVLLTHAHLDHSGLLPRLAALGFRGPIYATRATIDLAKIMLLDAAHIQEKEAEWQNRHFRSRHVRRGWDQAPLYTVAQAQACLKQFLPVDYERAFSPQAGVRVCFRDAGHILGSAILEIWIRESAARETKLVVSGDLGQPARPLLPDPSAIVEADHLLIESTYGNRLHRSLAATENELVDILARTLPRGNVLIPAFAVGRTQTLIAVLAQLVRDNRIDRMDVYVDSPMAAAATTLTLEHEALLDAETRDLLAWQRHHSERVRMRFTESVEESMSLNRLKSGAIIISASGMCDAGRIRHHLRHNLPRRECAVVISGFQAAGTLGRRLVDGAREVTMFGERFPVRASIHTLGGLSAHADQAALMGWLRHFRAPPKTTHVVHGELETARLFAERIRHDLTWPQVRVAERGIEVSL